MHKEFDFTTFWVEYIKNNPDWRIQHTNFLNAIYSAHKDWYYRIVCKPNGVNILRELYGVKNKKIITLWEEDAKSAICDVK